MLNKKMRGVATGGSRWNKLWTAPRAVLLGAGATVISHATMETSGRIRQERKHPPGLQLRHANAEAGGGSIKSSAATSAAEDVGESRAVAEKAAAAVTPTSDEEAAREVEKASFLRTGKSKTRQRNPPPGVPPGGVGVGSPVVLPQMQLPPPPPPHFPLPHFAPPQFPPPSTYPYPNPNPKHMMHNGHGDATTSKSTCCADDEDEAVNIGLPSISFPTNPSDQAPTSTTGATSISTPGLPLPVTPVEPGEPEDLTKATNLPPGISEVFALRGDELLSSGQFELKHMNEPTHGNVHYVDDEALLYKKLPGTKQGKLIMDEQWQNQGYAHGKQHGYKSFRFVSNPTLGPGTVIMWDAEHIPVGHGVWPAYWTVDVSCWPDCGEIDMHEGINMDDHMHSKLHTGNKIVSHPTCRALICHDPKDPNSNDCKNPNCFTDFDNGSYGCGGEWKRPNGKAYNDAGGALHVLAWTKKWLKMWLWKRNEIPKGLKWNDVSDLGKLADGTMPDAYATWSFENGKCDHKELNGRHNFIINLTTCGDWAGAVYNHNGGTGPDACKKYIKTEEARNAWKELNNGEMPHYLLNSLRLYKVPDLR